MKLLSIIILLCLLCGCSDEFHERENVEAIYWHEGTRYSAAFRSGGAVTLKRIPVTARYSWRGSVEVITDADSGSWYECKWSQNEWTGTQKGAWCKIHIASIDDLRTGGWNHGKFGSGETRRID